MSISTPFIRRPIGTSLLMAAIFLVGLAAYPLLPSRRCRRWISDHHRHRAIPGAIPHDGLVGRRTAETQFSQINGLAQMTSVNV